MATISRYTELKTLFTKNLTRDSLRTCARRLGLNHVGLKKIELEDMIIGHVLKWGLTVEDLKRAKYIYRRKPEF